MENNFDIEEEREESGGNGLTLVVMMILVSVAVHVGLMYTCSDYPFAPLPEDAKIERKLWKKPPPPMKVQKRVEDPLAKVMGLEARPVAAPVQERQEDRVNRLAAASESAIAPEQPRSASLAPTADVAAEPAKVNAAEWKPRQQIAAIESPVVPDDQAALPRLVIPKVERVKAADDIVPAFELMERPSGKSAGIVGGEGSLVVAASAGKDGAAPLPPTAGMPRGTGLGGGASGLGLGQPPTLTVLSAAEEAAAKKAADDARAAEKAGKAADRLAAEAVKKPVPPAPAASSVDEKVVAREKEAVRSLRDETTPQGRAFEQNVRLSLGSWIDPSHPADKYFRIRISSNADNPLPVVSKDMIFLLDASGSIANDRLKRCRKAIVKALRLLNTGDRFNVIAFRDRFTYAFPEAAWKDVSEKTLEQAEDWLNTLTAHGQTDVFSTLRGVLAMPREATRPVVAFVITDGDATSGMTRSAEIISKFNELNGGLISVYMYGVKDTANQYLMDMVTHGSRGAWDMNKQLRWNAADGIPELAKQFERPVLADLSVLFAASSGADVYPRLLPNLCMGVPVEIYGKCPADQKELVFSVRGLNAATVYESLFRLSFADATGLNDGVKKLWAQKRMHALVAQYTAHPSNALLKSMHEFSARYGVTIPYEKEMK